MTTEEMERAIGFLLDHHAKVSADIERHSEQIGELTKTVQSLAQTVDATRSHLDSVIDEMRDGFNKLIAANELTNSLIEKLTLLEVQNSQRLNAVERRVDNLETS